ncbi:MAG: pyrroline-5-carboxylate reductase [Clostridia bacterium]|nr:pyrroline-5-carboxylate reductase [Clostridia bacterium]
MKKLFKLGVIGCGVMADAVLRGATKSDFLRPKKIIVSDTDKEKLTAATDLGIEGCSDNKYVAENSEYLLLAVKPQSFDEVAKDLLGVRPEKVISIMAGVTKSTIRSALGVGVKVVRVMPNLPCTIGSGMMAVDMYDFGKNFDDTDFVTNLFDCMGTVMSCPEEKMNAVTGLSGSGPAYVYMFIDALIDAGVAQGLKKEEARLLAVQTVMGAAEMVQREDTPMSELIAKVCSKGGTTIEAVKVLEDRDMRGIVGDAVDACVKRAAELSK